jgi:hypothetical protein
MKSIVSGNLNKKNKKSPEKRGWFIGHFINGGPFQTKDLEVNWGVHKKGDQKTLLAANSKAKTLCVLIKGKMNISFPGKNKEINLVKQGDFVYWGNGVAHTWKSLTNSVCVVVRWPSIPEDQKPNN